MTTIVIKNNSVWTDHMFTRTAQFTEEQKEQFNSYLSTSKEGKVVSEWMKTSSIFDMEKLEMRVKEKFARTSIYVKDIDDEIIGIAVAGDATQLLTVEQINLLSQQQKEISFNDLSKMFKMVSKASTESMINFMIPVMFKDQYEESMWGVVANAFVFSSIVLVGRKQNYVYTNYDSTDVSKWKLFTFDKTQAIIIGSGAVSVKYGTDPEGGIRYLDDIENGDAFKLENINPVDAILEAAKNDPYTNDDIREYALG